MNKEDYKIILDSAKGKAKGVLMQNSDSEQNIPQIVGLSKFQLLLLIVLGILVGAGTFGLGYLFHQNQEQICLYSMNALPQGKYQIGQLPKNQPPNLKQQKQIAANSEINAEEESFTSKNSYIFIGKYNTVEEAQKIQNKIQMKSGKLATLKQTNEGILVYIGPFESESLAHNEKNLMSQKSYIFGSITNAF